MNSRDQLILAALEADPSWFGRKLAPRLSGYPDPAKCWIWTGASSTHGRVGLPGTKPPIVLVHRAVFLAVRGPIPHGLVLDHDGPCGCHNRLCANPDHLLPATQYYNVAISGSGPAAVNLAKERCPHGHVLGGANVEPSKVKHGWRSCRACHQRDSRKQYRAIAAAAQALGLSIADYLAAHGASVKRALNLTNGVHK